MTKTVITESLKEQLVTFLDQNSKADLVTTYLFYLEKKFQLKPVLFVKEKIIYQSLDELIKQLEIDGKLWRETEIKIQVGQPSVNERTAKIYICPFTGKVFGDNTHPNPQDAIYDWVSKCPENTERVNGLKVKRFFVSEDPEVIKNYIEKRKEPVSKIVYSSAITGKLFNTKKAVIDDFKKNHLKPLTLVEVANQNRFNLEDHLLNFIQEHMDETRITAFVEAMSKENSFTPHVDQWLK
ncbi:MAG: hypothetical protein S4CHLAM37_05600 [Chlamydiia bacterium]|nr:hypothetical protein [Chlamydiia bacterium]